MTDQTSNEFREAVGAGNPFKGADMARVWSLDNSHLYPIIPRFRSRRLGPQTIRPSKGSHSPFRGFIGPWDRILAVTM